MRTPVIIIAGILLLLALGCSDQATNPEPTSVAEPETGEVPADLKEVIESNTPRELDFSPEGPQLWPNWPDWPDIEYIENCDVYAVTFLWTDLFDIFFPGIEPMDWSGTLSVNGEAVVYPRMAIHFEEGEDWIVEEDIPHSAEWVSQVFADFDGISFLVFYRTDVVYIVAPTLTFESGPITLKFDFGELVKLDEFHPIYERGAVAVHSRKIWPPRCPGGFMEGRWIKDDNTGSTGTIEGIWMNREGDPEGYINGQFTTDDNGHREISGWVSGYFTDHIIAEFKGTWWYDDPRMCITCGVGRGMFRGHFVYADGTNRGGMLAGEFGSLEVTPELSDLDLPFHGIWQEFCPWEPEHPGTEITP